MNFIAIFAALYSEAENQSFLNYFFLNQLTISYISDQDWLQGLLGQEKAIVLRSLAQLPNPNPELRPNP